MRTACVPQTDTGTVRLLAHRMPRWRGAARRHARRVPTRGGGLGVAQRRGRRQHHCLGTGAVDLLEQGSRGHASASGAGWPRPVRAGPGPGRPAGATALWRISTRRPCGAVASSFSRTRCTAVAEPTRSSRGPAGSCRGAAGSPGFRPWTFRERRVQRRWSAARRRGRTGQAGSRTLPSRRKPARRDAANCRTRAHRRTGSPGRSRALRPRGRGGRRGTRVGRPMRRDGHDAPRPVAALSRTSTPKVTPDREAGRFSARQGRVPLRVRSRSGRGRPVRSWEVPLLSSCSHGLSPSRARHVLVNEVLFDEPC